MTANARRGLSVTVLATALLTAACVTATENFATRVEEAAEDRSVVEPGDAIAILPQKAVGCVNKSLRQVQPGLRIVPPDEFRRVAFPDEPRDRISFTYPVPEAQRQLLSGLDFRDRVAPLKLRYLVSIGEATGTTWQTATGGGVGATWDKTLTLIASVIDLKDARPVGRIVVDAHGAGIAGVLFFVPFLAVTTTHGPACTALGEALASFLIGRFPYARPRAPEPGR